MAFSTYGVENPTDCRRPPEMLEDERTDSEGPQKYLGIKECTEGWLVLARF